MNTIYIKEQNQPLPSETLFTSSKASKVALGTLRAIGLQITSEAKDTFDNFLHVSVTMKTVVRGNSRAGDTEVNTALGRWKQR